MKIHYPEALPISSHSEELIKAIRQNDVTLIVGETGSGKSTQIPKMISEALETDALIACTQPRRIAAVSIAARIAEECGVETGMEIGYKIRFDDHTHPGTKIIICTDGILLQEIKFDVLLSKYDAIFVDEAHERSLRIDFLLGLLKDIQRKRLLQNIRPLKIIIASATLDTKKFVKFFQEDDARVKDGLPLPTLANFSIAGRMFPVDVEYHPLSAEETFYSKIAGIVQENHLNPKSGDILIFLPGEQEITTTIKVIQELGFSDLRCLPLFGRLSMEEQTSIYPPHPNKRHVVVSTNIAETSLTVPGITMVIDSGLARMTDFDTTTGIGSLRVEKISQASAIQRTGRAGRIEPGKCYRLYSEEDFKSRELYTRPEIQRSDLADVVLQMILMGIPNIHEFEFMDPPDPASFHQALKTLRTLGALDRQEKLTKIGYKMAHLPLDPRISRMLLTAEQYDCVGEVAVIASFLSLKDPFWRPFGDEERADKARSYFQRLGMPSRAAVSAKPFFNGRKFVYRKTQSGYGNSQWKKDGQIYHSDLLTYLALWKKVFLIADESGREQYCAANYLNYLTLEEARSIYLQLIDTLKQFFGQEFNRYIEKKRSMLEPENLEINMSYSDNVGILKSIASGLVQNLCQRNRFGNYSSSQIDHIFIHPGSLFFNRYPQWIIATEIIETTKLFARNITEVDPAWFQEYLPGRKSGKRRFTNHHENHKVGHNKGGKGRRKR